MPRGDQTDRAQRPHGHASGPLGTASQIRNPAPALPLQQRVSLFIAYVNRLTRSWKQAPLGTACQIRNPARGKRRQRPYVPAAPVSQKPQRTQATGCALPDDHGQLTRGGACQIRNRSHSLSVHHPEGLCCTVQDKASGSWEWRRCRAGCRDHDTRRSWVSAPVRRL